MGLDSQEINSRSSEKNSEGVGIGEKSAQNLSVNCWSDMALLKRIDNIDQDLTNLFGDLNVHDNSKFEKDLNSLLHDITGGSMSTGSQDSAQSGPSSGDGPTSQPTAGDGTTKPTDGSGTTTKPTDGSGTTTKPTDGSGTTTPPSDGSGTTTPPSDGSTTTPPSDGSGTTTPPSDGSGTTTPPSDGSGTTTPPSDGSGITTPPSDGSGITTPPSDTPAPSKGLLGSVAAGASGVSAEQVANDKNLQQAFSYGAAAPEESSNIVHVANQSQLDQLLQKNGNTLKNVTVELDGGAYNINKTITLGGGATIESADPNNRATLNWTGSNTASEFWVDGDGNQASNLNVGAAGNYAFSVEHATNTTVSGVNIQDQPGKALTGDGFDVEGSSHTTIAGTTTQEVEGYSAFIGAGSKDTLLYGDNFGVASAQHQGGSEDQWNVRAYGANGFAMVGSTVNQPQLETPGSPIKGDLEVLGGSETPGGTSNPAIVADSQILGTAKNQALAPGQVGQLRGMLVGQLDGNSWVKNLTKVAEKVKGITDPEQAQAWAVANYPTSWSQAQADLKEYSQYMSTGDFHGELTANVNGQRFADAPASLVAQDEQSVGYRADVVADNNTIEGSVQVGTGGTLSAENNKFNENVPGVGAFATSTGGLNPVFDSVPGPQLNLSDNSITLSGGGAQWLTNGGGNITGNGNTANGVAVNA